MNPSRRGNDAVPQHVVPMRAFDSHDAIEGYLDRLNHSSPLAERSIIGWGGRERPHLQLGTVPLTVEGTTTDTMFLAEAQMSFGMEVRSRGTAAAGAPYSVGLVLAGSMRATLPGGAFVARAGEGVIIDPSQVESTQFSANSHFVEFMLPQIFLSRLGDEAAQGGVTGSPQFSPLLHRPLAQRLCNMATQTAEALRADRQGPGSRVIFERWMELIALTLLLEQQHAGEAPAVQIEAIALPRSLNRALDFIDAHAQANIMLADIAAAACVSASALLRQFNEHLGQSPGAFLRQVRLDRARAELRQGLVGSIRELAQRWGFQSPAKFSEAYLRRFGERPRAAR